MTERMGMMIVMMIIGIARVMILMILVEKTNVIVKLKINVLIGLCNLENVMYQGIIFPKENIKNRKNLYRNLINKREVTI